MTTFPGGCTPELKIPAIWQVIMSLPTGTTPQLPQPWCTDLKKPFTGHAAALVAAEDSWDGELPRARKAYAAVTSQCLQFRASVEAFFLPLSHPAPTAVPAVPLTLLPGSSCCCSCFCLFVTPLFGLLLLPLPWLFPRTVLPLAPHSATVRTQPEPMETRVFACTLPVLGVGCPCQSQSLHPCKEWQQPYRFVCGVWRFERTQHRSYYYLLLILKAE